MTIAVHRDMCSELHLRYKFEIIAMNAHGAQHFSFVRFFATGVSDNVIKSKTRSEIAAILRVEHKAAWERYHRYVE
jgi:hypothetical protein